MHNLHTEKRSHTSTETGPEINTEKTKYTFMSHHQTAGQNHCFIINTSLKKCGKFQTFKNENNKSELHTCKN